LLCLDDEESAAKRRRVETEFPPKMLIAEIAYSAWLLAAHDSRKPVAFDGVSRMGRAKNARK